MGVTMLVRLWRVASIARLSWRFRRSRHPEEREDLAATLRSRFGKAGGILMKLGQARAMAGHGAIVPLLDGAPARDLAALVPGMRRAFGVPVSSVFRHIDPRGLAASVGQVHRAVLLDGTTVAVKVLYPEVRRAVKAELRIASWLPPTGPLRRAGFDLAPYRALMRENMARELDLASEAERQILFGEQVRLPGLVVPRVHRELCRDTVLVQSWEEGVGVQEAKRWSLRERLELTQTALRTLFHTAFVNGTLHADPHAGNVLFRRGPARAELVLVDYGSTLHLDPSRRQALLALVLALRAGQASRVVPCLVAFGFDAEKLRHVSREAVDLCRALFAPLLSTGHFALDEWRPSEQAMASLGDMRWWFRAAAPPDCLLLVRAFAGFARLVEELNTCMPWWPVLRETVPESLFESAEGWQSPPMPVPAERGGLATRLHVALSEGERRILSLAIPASEALTLRRQVPSPVVRQLKAHGLRLAEVERRVRDEGFAARELVSEQLGDRRVVVWLE